MSPEEREYRNTIRRVMRPLAEALDELNVSYAVVGSIAGMSHGYGRPTIDVDVLAELEVQHVAELTRHFDLQEYYVDETMILDAIKHEFAFNIVHYKSGVKLDVFISKRRPHDLQVVGRREPEKLLGDDNPAFYVQSAEDSIVSKLQWFQQTNGTSDRQWNDILAIAKLQQFNLDFDYLEYWAGQTGVEDLLNDLLDQAGLKNP